jgi:flagellar biosynthesis protein FlhA
VIGEVAGPLLGEAKRFCVVTSPIARRPLARLLAPHLRDVPVLSFLEIPDGKSVDVVAVVGGGLNNKALPAEASA